MNAEQLRLHNIIQKRLDNHESIKAVKNIHCHPETLKMVLERNQEDTVSGCAARNKNCSPETLKMILERNNNNDVSYWAAGNPNCPPKEKIQWMRNNGYITQEDPQKHIIDYSGKNEDKDNDNEDLQLLKNLLR